MYAIPLYPPDAEDFSTNGLGLMLPTECTIEEIKNGMFELKMVQPITDDYRWAQVEIDCLLKAAAPVRESPLYELAASTVDATTQTTVTRKVYTVKTNGGRLHLRQKPSTSSKILSKYKVGTKVILLEDNGKGWYRVSIASGGATGWMYAQYLKYSHDTTETITSTKVVTQEEMRVMPSRDQLFRVYSIENDTESGLQTVRALHIFYDLRRNVIDDDYKPSKAVVSTVAKEVFSKALVPHDFDVHVGKVSGTVTGEYGYKGITEVFLAPETGIAAQCNGYIVRDNFDMFLLPNEVRDTGVTIRRGKNLIGVVVTTDESTVVNRIVPCGQNKDGDPLYLSGVRYIDSPRNTEKTIIKAARIDYDVKVSDDDDAEFKTDAAAREEMKRLVNADYDAGIDLPSYGMEVDFVILANTAEYADYAEYLHLQSVHLFDTITVIDELIGIKAKVCVTGYVWNVLTEQYDSVTLGEIQSLSQKTYGYSISEHSISGNKIINGTVDGAVLRDLTIQYAKIAIATIKQLNAEAVNAIIGRFEEIAAGKITTDELYAAFAEILNLAVGNITADNIETDTLAAALGNFVTLYSKFAGLDFTTIKDLDADEAIFRVGVAGELYIDRLAVTSANIIAAVLGELVLRGDDGNYYRLHVGSDGIIHAELHEVTDEEIANGSTSDGLPIVASSINVEDLNAQTIKAASAIISEIFTDALTAGKVTAGQAFIASATIPELSTVAIRAVADSLDLSANSTIQMLIASNDLVRAWFTFTEDGLRTGKAGSTYATLTNDVGFHVLQLDEIITSINRRQVSAEAFRVGKVASTEPRYILREAPDGGMMIVLEATEE